MALDVIDTRGNRSPFSIDEFTGWLVRAGLAGGDALEYSRAIQRTLISADVSCISTIQLRVFATDLMSSSAYELATDGLVRRAAPDLSTSSYIPSHRRRRHIAPGGVLKLEPLASDLIAQPGPFLKRVDTPPGDPCGQQMSRALADKTLAATLGSDQVREALKGKRYAVISIDFDHTRFDQKGNPVNAQVVLFNYTDDVSIHILTELSAFQVTSVSPVLHHPPLTTEELQQAIRLASADERVKPHLSPEMTATGIRMSDEDRDLGEPSRQVLVLFGHDDQREAELWSLVDLSADAVRDAGGARDAVRGKERST